MELLDAIRKRRSIRAFRPDPVSEDTLARLLECADLAPSAGNLQGYEIVVVKDPKKKRELARASFDQGFISEAPVVLVFTANLKRSASRYGRRGQTLYAIQDATIATAYVHLACVEFGLGSCWVGAFDDKEVARIIGAGEEHLPVSILPIGYPAEDPSPRPRRGIKNITHLESLKG